MIDNEVTYLVCDFATKSIPDTQPTLVIPTNRLNDCCGDFSLKALAHTINNDEFVNDKNEFVFYFGALITSAVIKLQKYQNGTFVDIATLNDNTFGTFKAFGFYKNSFNQNFINYILEWQKVLIAQGEGSYRLKCTCADGDLYTREYCLHTYTPERANGTIRVEFRLNDMMGDSQNDYSQRDYGQQNFLQQYRFKGLFDYQKSAYTKDYIQYRNGQMKWVSDEQEPEYRLYLNPQPFFVHDILRIDMMQAESVKITDYNTNSATQWVNKEVQANSEFAPEWNVLSTKLAPVEIQFKQFANNLKKNRSV